MTKSSQESARSLYRSVRWLRHVLPITAFLFVLAHQSVTNAWFRAPQWSTQHLWQALPYATIGPIVIWLALTWFARWAREREQAEKQLRCLNEISRQAATATEIEALVNIALRMPEEVINPVATSLIMREHPDGPWSLAGTYGLQPIEDGMLIARLTTSGSDLHCGRCAAFSATAHQDCPLLTPLAGANRMPPTTSVICLPLSTERPPVALLNVYLFDDRSLAPGMRRVLESMAAVLSVALDHARLRTREFQMLHGLEQASRQQLGLAATLEHILGDMATAHRAQAGEIFLTSPNDQEPTLTASIGWPADQPHSHLMSIARKALLEEDLLTTTDARRQAQVIAIPLVAEGLTMGVLALASQHPFSASQRAFLQVAAGMIALIIRNIQLYAELESQAVLEERNRLAREFHDGLAQGLGFLNFKMQQADRLLARQEWEAAREALGEMRAGIQDLYAEVRQTIQDLRRPPQDGQALSERLHRHVLEFSTRTGLDVALAIEGEPRLSARDEVHLLRIVQEALTNVHKHAQAQHVWVQLRANAETTTLEIEDDGTGILAEAETGARVSSASGATGHFGLRIMQERAEAMGGQLSLHSVPNRGTRLVVTLGASQALDPHTAGVMPEGR